MKQVFIPLIFLVVGILAGAWVANYYNAKNNVNPVSEFHSGGYKFINPLYECNTNPNYGRQRIEGLQSRISDYIDSVKAQNPSVISVSVYYRDLNNGPWFGINEHDDFAPSSLLKTPVMMAYYKKAESDPGLLEKKIKYDHDPVGVIPQNYKPENPMVKGQEYTIENLIERMIAGSDNVALRLLEENISDQEINKVTEDLGITTATNATPQDFMDVEEYSTLFRVLYNATYLNRDYSEKALKVLSKSEFSQGLVASVPKDVTVSHKMGERTFEDGTHQLHDCGIVYYPNNPYLLCIMTKGSDFDDLASTIRQVSSRIYAEVKKANP